MSGKKITLFGIALLMVLAMSVPPASAGVGGCRFNCGGGWEFANTASVVKSQKPSVLDALSWILPQDVIAAGKTLVNGDKGHKNGPSSTTEGVGGCRINCGKGGL